MRSISFLGMAALVFGLLSGPALATDVDAAKLGQKIADVTPGRSGGQNGAAARPGRHEGDRRRLPVV